MVRTVLNTMIANKVYFFFVLNPVNMAITFRSVMETENLAGLKDNIPKIMGANTTDDEYNKISEAFNKNSASKENILNILRQRLGFLISIRFHFQYFKLHLLFSEHSLITSLKPREYIIPSYILGTQFLRKPKSSISLN